MPHHRVLECDAVGAQQGSTFTGNSDGFADVVELAEADLLGCDLALVLDAPQLDGEQE